MKAKWLIGSFIAFTLIRVLFGMTGLLIAGGVFLVGLLISAAVVRAEKAQAARFFAQYVAPQFDKKSSKTIPAAQERGHDAPMSDVSTTPSKGLDRWKEPQSDPHARVWLLVPAATLLILLIVGVMLVPKHAEPVPTKPLVAETSAADGNLSGAPALQSTQDVSESIEQKAMEPLTPSLSTDVPSFDCAKAQRAAEILVCSDTTLSNLDTQMAALYVRLLKDVASPQALRSDQLQWLHTARDPCPDSRCLEDAYTRRIATFKKALQVPVAEQIDGAERMPRR